MDERKSTTIVRIATTNGCREFKANNDHFNYVFQLRSHGDYRIVSGQHAINTIECLRDPYSIFDKQDYLEMQRMIGDVRSLASSRARKRQQRLGMNFPEALQARRSELETMVSINFKHFKE